MKVEKAGRKWVIKGDGDGWVFDKQFRTKWRAEIACEVFKIGGKFSDYRSKVKEEIQKRPRPDASRVRERVKIALETIKSLNPTCEEIQEYGENADYGVVTHTDNEEYFAPHLHDTWGLKMGGRVHIDIGCCGTHLMLDKDHAENFIEFIKGKRNTD